MDAPQENSQELDKLLHQLCDNLLDESGRARLARMLAESEVARQRYLEFVDLCIGVAYATPDLEDRDSFIAQELGATIPIDGFTSPPGASPDSSSASLQRTNARHAGEQVETGEGAAWIVVLRDQWRALGHRRLVLPAAAVLLLGCFGVLRMLEWFGPNHQPQPTEVASASEQPADFVARMLNITNDTTWEDPSAQADSLFRLKADETIRVATGFVRIEFVSGATVIVQAPAVFTPTGPDAARLDRGRVTGKAANGNFRLTTKAAEVIDLGTEFGVAVDDVTGTDVLVFDGEVEVVPHVAGPVAGRVLKMTEGMATRITPEGNAVHNFPAQPDGFSRSFPSLRNRDVDNELSLVDVICGGDGFGNYLAGAIDPRTGERDSGVWLRSWGAGRRKGASFHPTTHRLPLDGVFIPNVEEHATQIDSVGTKVVLPCYTSQTFGPIWARRGTKALDAVENAIDFWGPDTFDDVNQRLQSTRHGVIGLHASVGFTVDLQAVRMRQHCDIDGFEAVIALLAPYQDRQKRGDPAQTSADFRVYVDGELRGSRLSIKRADGDVRIAVSLTPLDQRITLVSTDGDDSILFDDLVLIDPILMLNRSTRSEISD